MALPALIAFLHFAAAFGLVAALFFEWFTFSRTPTLDEARRIALADRFYGLSAVALLVVGLVRAAHFEKGWAFYAASPFFHAKLTLFVVIGLLSIYPTVRFMRWGAELRAGRAPAVTEAQHRWIARCLAWQLLLLVPLVGAASLMAKGVGL
jgi:putative membrane protein